MTRELIPCVEAAALLQLGLAEVAKIETDMNERIFVRIANGENDAIVQAEERKRALDRFARIDASIVEAIYSNHTFETRPS